jgi:DNA-binding transcriptional LysR family regulator
VLLDLPYSAQYFLSLFEARGLVPNVIARSGNQDVIRTMVANDYGYTILNVRPKSMVAMDGRKLKAIRLAEQHTPTRIGVMTLAGTSSRACWPPSRSTAARPSPGRRYRG